ncbi:zinc-binding dehydrogenase [Algoriphagus confluentis]|uniref:Zinc-binding dehydrogenase n=1 Tax=Algoriphagus confluentis TaxID=1697556 RepID=A0ABQ6PHW2_9BACT|nr:zinc-binding dehydrogenase [Algoriphagus confluentis]
MKAVVLNQDTQEKIQVLDLPKPSVTEGEALVRIHGAALNHRDEWSRKGLYPNLKNGIILGSDGAGVVEAVGSDRDSKWLNQAVIINPALFWGEDQKAQGRKFEILGMPRNGTFAEYVVVPVDRLVPKPSHLSWEEAAALPLAGLTAYRALVYQGQVKEGEQVLITGIGGGVAQFAAQFAHALGARVFVSSSQSEKLQKAKELGYRGGFNYREKDWVSQALELTGGFDLIIDGAAGEGINDLIQACKPGARIVFYGATAGNPSKLEARRIFWNQLKIMGSTMGSDEDFRSMIDLVESHQLHPTVDQVFPLSQALDAFDRMKAGKQLGKIILKP